MALADWLWPLVVIVVGFVCERMGYARGRAEACRFFMRARPSPKEVGEALARAEDAVAEPLRWAQAVNRSKDA